MGKFIQKASIALVTLVAIFNFGLAPALAASDCLSNAGNPQAAAQCGINGGSGQSQDATTATHSVNSLISTILNILSSVVGVIAVIMIIVAGLRYISSGGSEQGIKSAKSTLLYAVVGLAIVAVAQILVHFVLTTSTGNCVKGKDGYHYSISGASCTP